jgi:hypothetical protein
VSAAAGIVRTNDHGVLLRYATDVRGPHRNGLRRYPSDRLRGLVLRAERELGAMLVMVECVDISDVARDRFAWGFRSIQAALDLARAEMCGKDLT